MRVPWHHPVQRRAASVTVATLLTLARLSTASAQLSGSERPPLSELERAVHLLNRTTYGARPRDLEELLALGADAWLERQLNPERIWVRPFVASLPLHQQRQEPGSGAPEPTSETNLMELERRAAVMIENGATSPAVAQVSLKLERALSSPRQLEEVLTDFWFNHFNVFYHKAQVRTVLVEYENVAIRPYVFRRFEDMLLETARHPAMLMYLDNYLSRVPGPEGEPSVGGINENYARELLELHTLGVDGGYTQQDVIEVARAFTGWTVPMRPGVRGGPPRIVTEPRVRFEFLPAWHDRGEKVVLGETLPAGRGWEDGLDVLRMLARHPSTARHVATKLARHFVADEPPAELVDDLTRVYLETTGDLRELSRALFTSEAFYDPLHFRAKVKRPFEFVVSALRMTGGDLELREVNLEQQRVGVIAELQALRHVPYSESQPTGFPITSDQWLSAGAMVMRMNTALDLTSGRVPGVKMDLWRALDATSADSLRFASVEGGDRAEVAARISTAVLAQVFPGRATGELHSLITEDLLGHDGTDAAALVARALALALGSPQFQRY